MRWLSRSSRPDGDALIGKHVFFRGANCRSGQAAPWPLEERQGRGALRNCEVAMVIMMSVDSDHACGTRARGGAAREGLDDDHAAAAARTWMRGCLRLRASRGVG